LSATICSGCDNAGFGIHAKSPFISGVPFGNFLECPPNRAGYGSTHQRGDGYCLQYSYDILHELKMQEKKTYIFYILPGINTFIINSPEIMVINFINFTSIRIIR
jgi:hypothetical protein